jgi:hypothetical protein
MRRQLGLLLATLLAVLVLAVPAAAFGDTTAAPTALVLAVEEGDPVGPDPMPRDAEGNPARELAGYEDRDLQFTWGAAWLLSFAGLVSVTLGGILYYVLVHRPSQQAGAGSGR